MKIELVNFIEQEDGGATLELDMDAEGHRYLLNFAILEIIKKGLFEVEEMYENKQTV